MKISKFLFTALAVILMTSFASAQSAERPAKVENSVEALNNKLTKADSKLALTAEQKTTLEALYADEKARLKALGTEKTEDIKSKKKAIRQEVNQKVNNDILTAEQREALKKMKKEKKKGPKKGSDN